MDTTSFSVGTQQTEFSKEMLKQKGLVLVEFFAIWSGASHIMNPVFKEIRENFADYVRSFRLDIDTYKELADEFGIRNAPAYILLQNGKVLDMYQGMISKKILLNKIKIVVRNN